jgi:hypothetical protein
VILDGLLRLWPARRGQETAGARADGPRRRTTWGFGAARDGGQTQRGRGDALESVRAQAGGDVPTKLPAATGDAADVVWSGLAQSALEGDLVRRTAPPTHARTQSGQRRPPTPLPDGPAASAPGDTPRRVTPRSARARAQPVPGGPPPTWRRAAQAWFWIPFCNGHLSRRRLPCSAVRGVHMGRLLHVSPWAKATRSVVRGRFLLTAH